MIFETQKIKKGTAVNFNVDGELGNEPLAYRVEDSSRELMVMVNAFDPNITLTICGSNHVFGGTDTKFILPQGVVALILDASVYVQTDGENKGCIVLHTGDVPCKIDVKEIC